VALFVGDLRASLARITPEERRPLELVQTQLPRFVMPWGGDVRQSSELLLLMGENVAALILLPAKGVCSAT